MDSNRTVIRLKEEDVRKDYDQWIGLTQCESYAMTFLAKHPGHIGKHNHGLGGGWKLAGIEVWLAPIEKGKRKGKRADLVFTREGGNRKKDYLVVETEDYCTFEKISDGWDQAKGYARLLEEHLGHKFPHNPVLEAVAAVEYPVRKGSRTSWTCGGKVPD